MCISLKTCSRLSLISVSLQIKMNWENFKNVFILLHARSDSDSENNSPLDISVKGVISLALILMTDILFFFSVLHRCYNYSRFYPVVTRFDRDCYQIRENSCQFSPLDPGFSCYSAMARKTLLSSAMNSSSTHCGIRFGTNLLATNPGAVLSTVRRTKINLIMLVPNENCYKPFLKIFEYHILPDRNRADHWLPFITLSVLGCRILKSFWNASDGDFSSDKYFPIKYPSCIAWFAPWPRAGEVAWAASPMRQILSLCQYGNI